LVWESGMCQCRGAESMLSYACGQEREARLFALDDPPIHPLGKFFAKKLDTRVGNP
jgi:hypothetical protein